MILQVRRGRKSCLTSEMFAFVGRMRECDGGGMKRVRVSLED